MTIDLPIDAGNVNDHINHVTAQFICLHVHWTAVCGNVNLTDHIKKEGLLNARVLKTKAKKFKSFIITHIVAIRSFVRLRLHAEYTIYYSVE